MAKKVFKNVNVTYHLVFFTVGVKKFTAPFHNVTERDKFLAECESKGIKVTGTLKRRKRDATIEKQKANIEKRLATA